MWYIEVHYCKELDRFKLLDYGQDSMQNHECIFMLVGLVGLDGF